MSAGLDWTSIWSDIIQNTESPFTFIQNIAKSVDIYGIKMYGFWKLLKHLTVVICVRMTNKKYFAKVRLIYTYYPHYQYSEVKWFLIK